MIELAVTAEQLGYNLMAVPYILEDLSVLKGLLAGYTAHAKESCRAHSGPRVTVAFHIHVAPTVERIKLMKLLWDALASEFGGRHELYEHNYSGNVDDARIQTLLAATATGTTEAMKALVDQCLSEYDLDGWKIPGVVNPDDVHMFARRRRESN